MGQCKSLLRGPEIRTAVPKFHIPPVLGPLHLKDEVITPPSCEWEEFEPVVIDWSLVNGLVPFSIHDRNCILHSSGSEFHQLGTSKEILETFKGSPDNLGLGISRNQTVELVHNDNLVVDDASLMRLRNAIDFWSAFQPSQDALDRLSKYPNIFSYTQPASDDMTCRGSEEQQQPLGSTASLLSLSSSSASASASVAPAAASASSGPGSLHLSEASADASSVDLPSSQTNVPQDLPAPESSTYIPDYEIVIKPRYKTPGYPTKEYACITRMHPPSVPEREHPLRVQEYLLQCIGDFLDPYQVDRLKRENKLSLLLNQNGVSLFGGDVYTPRRGGRRHVHRALHGHDARKRMLLVNRAPNKLRSLSSLETIDEYPAAPIERRMSDFATLCQQAARVLDETCCVTQGPHGPFSETVAIRTVLKNKFGDWSDVPLL